MLPDPRDRRGRRHTLASVLAVSAAAVAAGARSVAAIAEWATDAPWPILAALGVRCDPLTRRCQVPGEATIRRVLARVDGDAVDAAVGAWLADRLHPPSHRRVLAVDGKRLRGSARDGHQVHLLAALDHHDGAVLAQRQVDGAPGEVPAFQPLLAGLDLAGVVVTADALHTQRDHASFLVGRGADYLLVVKANQPTLHTQLAGLPWRQIPVMDRTRDHGHGRIELRTLKVAAVAGLCFPHAAQAIQATRRVRAPGSHTMTEPCAHRRLGPSSSATTSTTERALPSSAVQRRCWRRPTTTTRLPLARDWTACSAWSRHTITMKKDGSCSRRFDTATRNMARVIPASVWRTSGWSVRLPAKLTAASVMVLPS